MVFYVRARGNRWWQCLALVRLLRTIGMRAGTRTEEAEEVALGPLLWQQQQQNRNQQRKQQQQKRPRIYCSSSSSSRATNSSRCRYARCAELCFLNDWLQHIHFTSSLLHFLPDLFHQCLQLTWRVTPVSEVRAAGFGASRKQRSQC